jgi:hypothetical protein
VHYVIDLLEWEVVPLEEVSDHFFLYVERGKLEVLQQLMQFCNFHLFFPDYLLQFLCVSGSFALRDLIAKLIDIDLTIDAYSLEVRGG